MKEIIQSIIPVISAFLAAGLTFYFQKKLMNKQFEIKKQEIKFEKNREALEELKSYQTTIVDELTFLRDLTKEFSKKKITEEKYEKLTEHKIVFLKDILSKAYTLHNKQLDFHLIGLTALYQQIENTLKKTLQNDEYNISEKIDLKVKNYDYLIDEYDYLIGKSKKLSDRIKEKAKEVS